MGKKPYDDAFTFKDDLAVREVFADGVHLITVDGTVAKITLTVSRPDDLKPGFKGPPKGHKVAVTRLAMPAAAFATLFNQMNNLMLLLEKQGLVKREGVPPSETVQ
jgi:hypothetical protein